MLKGSIIVTNRIAACYRLMHKYYNKDNQKAVKYANKAIKYLCMYEVSDGMIEENICELDRFRKQINVN